MFESICLKLRSLKDYRRGPVDHPLNGLLMIVLIGNIAGCRGWDAIADWGRAQYNTLKQYLVLGKKPASADTYRRAIEAYNLTAFFEAMDVLDGEIHFDGKRAKGANINGSVHHFIEALAGNKVIGMVETGPGAEGPGIIKLLAALNISGKLITIDAAGTTPAVVSEITRKGGDYLIALEPNQPSLLNRTKQAFSEHSPRKYKVKNNGHGRFETRTSQTICDPEIINSVSSYSAIDGIRSICCIVRTRVTKDGIETTSHYHISSRRLSARQYARIVRSHWSIEAMHHVLDVSLNEDLCRICNSAGAVGFIRRFAYSVISEIKGRLSFRRFSEIMRANPILVLKML